MIRRGPYKRLCDSVLISSVSHLRITHSYSKCKYLQNDWNLDGECLNCLNTVLILKFILINVYSVLQIFIVLAATIVAVNCVPYGTYGHGQSTHVEPLNQHTSSYGAANPHDVSTFSHTSSYGQEKGQGHVNLYPSYSGMLN